MKRAILFFDVHQEPHTDLIEQVAGRGYLPIVMNADMSRRLSARQVEHSYWEEFAPANPAAELEAETIRIANGLSTALPDSEVQSGFNSIHGNILPALGNNFFDRMIELIQQQILSIMYMERIVRSLDLRAVVFGCDDNASQRAAVGFARNHGIPTLHLAHAIYRYTGAKLAGDICTLHSDYLAAYSEYACDLMAEMGNDRSRTIAVGCPAWDPLYRERELMSRSDARLQLGLHEDHPVILICASYSEGTYAYFGERVRRRMELYRSVATALSRADSRVQVIIRPHPLEMNRLGMETYDRRSLVAEYEDWMRSLGFEDPRVMIESKSEAIAAADLVLVEDESSVIGELMILQRPVVMMPKTDQVMTYGEAQGICVGWEHELPGLLQRLIQDPVERARLVERQNEHMESINHGNDGRATERVTALIDQLASGVDRSSKQPPPPRSQRDATKAKDSPRVLFAYRSDVDTKGGAAAVMTETATALRERGVEVDETYETYPDLAPYDLVHVFNAWHPESAIEQLRFCKDKDIPIVWSPIYLHWTECAWSSAAIRAIFMSERTDVDYKQYLDAMANGSLEVNGMTRWLPNEIIPGFHATIREMLTIVDHTCVTSYHEVRALMQVSKSTSVPFTFTPHGVDASKISGGDPRLFREAFGLDDFVLCVGAVDSRKNQLLLAESLRETDVPLVLLGPCFEKDYLELCMRRGNDNIRYTGRLDRAMVASALAAARVHALPSFAEGAALANLEAAVAECPMVVSNRSSEFEYFEDAPYYCDPADVGSIRDAVMQAFDVGRTDASRWQNLSAQVRERFTWQRTADLTVNVYRRVLGS